MYYINKIVGWVLSPMGVLFVGLGLGFALSRVRRWQWRRIGRVLVALTLVLIWVLGCGITTRIVGVPLEGDEVEVESVGVEPCDAIVVLGGGVGIHETCGRVELFSGADRIWTGVRLWKHRNKSVPLILGGGMNEKIAPLMEDFGVPREAWTFVEEARNTEEEAKLIRERLVEVKKILLVTSAWHMPRAKMFFERAGLEVVPGPTDYEMHLAVERPIEVWEFFPGADALTKNSWSVKEWVARVGYALLRR